MKKITLSLLAAGIALTGAACAADTKDPAAVSSEAPVDITTVTTGVIAEVVDTSPPPSPPTTVSAKPKAIPVTTKPATTAPKPTTAPPATTAVPLTTTPTTIATPTTVPVTATTTPPVETTTTTAVPTVSPTCTATVANPDAPKGSPQSVHLVSNMPDTKTRLTIQYPQFGTGKPNPRQEFKPVTDAAGSWTVEFNTIASSTVPAQVRVEFYNAAGGIMSETCSTTFNATA